MNLFFAVFALLLQQVAPASIEGFVVKRGSNEPIPGVSVELSTGSGTAAREVATVTTGDDGRFSFSEIPPGEYRLIATRSDGMYTPAEYGQRIPGGRALPITLVAGQRVLDARLEMAATGSIAGRVFDGDGSPVANARVMALNSIYRKGRRTLNIVQAVRTNDLGEYRLFWLVPERYYIGVMPQDLRSRAFSVYVTTPGRYGSREDASSPVIVRRTSDSGDTVEETWVMAYYGGGLDAGRALPIDLEPGASVGAVDIALNNSRVRSYRLRGVVLDAATGQPAADAHLRLVPRSPAPHLLMPNANADKSGVFDIGGVVPGSYFMVAAVRPGRGGGQGETFFDVANGPVAVVPIEVGEGDLDNLTVAVQPSFTIRGRLTSTANDIDWTGVRVLLTRDPDILGMPNAMPRIPGPKAPANGVPSAEGDFTLWGFSAGSYRLSVSGLSEDHYVKSMLLGNADVLSSGLHIDSSSDRQLEIVVEAGAAAVEGVVVNASQELAANATLVLVPEPALRERMDRHQNVSTDHLGRFRIAGISPGDYELFAWEVIAADAWHDPAFMRTVEGKGRAFRFNAGDRLQTRITVLP